MSKYYISIFKLDASNVFSFVGENEAAMRLNESKIYCTTPICISLYLLYKPVRFM